MSPRQARVCFEESLELATWHQIAQRVRISVSTVRGHFEAARKKACTDDQRELLRELIRRSRRCNPRELQREDYEFARAMFAERDNDLLSRATQ